MLTAERIFFMSEFVPQQGGGMGKIVKKEIGKRIESIRKSLGMSKEKFAKLIGVSGQYLGTVERGVNGFTVDTIVNICMKTGISADYILLGKDNSLNKTAVSTAISEFSQEQVELAFDIIKKVAAFLRTDDANEILIKEIFMNQLENVDPMSPTHTTRLKNH